MLKMLVASLIVAVFAGRLVPAAHAEEKRVLFLSKSQAFEHSPVAKVEGRPRDDARSRDRLSRDAELRRVPWGDYSLVYGFYSAMAIPHVGGLSC